MANDDVISPEPTEVVETSVTINETKTVTSNDETETKEKKKFTLPKVDVSKIKLPSIKFGKTEKANPKESKLKQKIENLTSNINAQKILFFVCRIIPAAILVTMFLIPMGMESVDLMNAEHTPGLIMPYKVPFTGQMQESFLHILYFSIYLIPFTALFTLISLFIKDNISRILFILTYISFTVYIFCGSTLIMSLANSPRWFLILPKQVYIVLGFSVIVHPCLSVYGLNLIRKTSPEYTEYKKMKEESTHNTKFSIKTKLTVTIISAVAVILVSFTYLILQSYQKMFTEAVGDVGRAQAEQAASVYDSAGGLYEKISTFFTQQKEANSYADSPFERIDIITPAKKITSKDELFLEKITNDTTLPEFDELSYTTAIGHVAEIPAHEKVITSEQAKEYLRRYKSGEYKKSPIYDKPNGTCKYIHPVTFTRKDGQLLQGFSVVTYKEEILMKAYFHTKVFVFTMSILFLYLSLIVALLIADFITNPLLYLRKNVKKTSDSLEMMLDKRSKVTSEELVYTDTIRTKDETKELSTEIKDLVSIIRGIVPYISFSTLQNADKDNVKKSYARELCFLFTDIRGFTTLCEGKQPREVVDILNHYLDIETEIILKNDGDVDKFVGDEMMAFFAGPRKEYNACKAAMEIRKAMYEQHKKALETGDDYINIGIGINTGKVIFGSVGSRSRMDFTSIGDTVNLAARLEGANKAYGSKTIITEAVYEKLHDTFVCRELDFITVKGKTEPVRIYEILQLKSLAAEKLYDIKNLFEKGLKEYRNQQWDKAAQYFMTCNQKYTDMPSVVFLNRIAHFKQNPPPRKWDGVFVMSVK